MMTDKTYHNCYECEHLQISGVCQKTGLIVPGLDTDPEIPDFCNLCAQELVPEMLEILKALISSAEKDPRLLYFFGTNGLDHSIQNAKEVIKKLERPAESEVSDE